MKVNFNYEEIKGFKDFLKKNIGASAVDAKYLMEIVDLTGELKLGLVCLCVLETGTYSNGKTVYFRMPRTKDLLNNEYDIDEVVQTLKKVPLEKLMVQIY